jgi:hypothetical protein
MLTPLFKLFYFNNFNSNLHDDQLPIQFLKIKDHLKSYYDRLIYNFMDFKFH